MSRVPLILLVLTLAIVLAARIFGPSDVHDKSQPKTLAYTADIVLHDRWMLPRDMAGMPARKPPMYNWIGVPFVRAFGWAEWSLKMPAILSGVATVAVVAFMGRRMFADPRLGLDADAAAAGGYVAAIVWLASYPAMKMMYLARPDMPLVAFLSGAWALGTVALTAPPDSRARVAPTGRWGFGNEGRSTSDATPHLPVGAAGGTWWIALGFWLCVAGAGLSKGPPALLAILYVLIAARPLHGRVGGALRRTGFAWGLPLSLALVGLWVWGAYRSAPEHFMEVLWGEEIADRFSRGEPLATQSFAHPFWITPWWFLRKFVPWSLVALVAILYVRPSRWLSHPITPALLWVALVLVFFAIPSGKRTDYLAPAYPAGAVLAAYGMLVPLRRLGGRPVVAGGLAMLVALAMAAYQWKAAPEAVDGAGDRIKAFVRDVRARVRDDERIVFTDLGWHPVQTLLRRHQTDPVGPADLEGDGWAIVPVVDVEGAAPVVTSGQIPQIRNSEIIEERFAGRLGLYRLPLPSGAYAPATTRPAGVEPVGLLSLPVLWRGRGERDGEHRPLLDVREAPSS